MLECQHRNVDDEDTFAACHVLPHDVHRARTSSRIKRPQATRKAGWRRPNKLCERRVVYRVIVVEPQVQGSQEQSGKDADAALSSYVPVPRTSLVGENDKVFSSKCEHSLTLHS
jgi:hypothetical protein